MPQVGFLCPDGVPVTHAACLAGCRMASRCLPEVILASTARTRPPSDLPSVTELTNPTRIAYLQRVMEYHVNPVDQLFALRGSAAHAFLNIDLSGHIQEVRIEIPGLMSGQPDDYDSKTKTLYDWKVIGHYKQRLMMADLAGAATDYIRQMNGYQLLLEHAGFPVSRRVLVAVTRDWRSYEYKKEVASQNPTRPQRTARVQPAPAVPPIVEYEVPLQTDTREWFGARAASLRDSLTLAVLPSVCTAEERWQDRRCEQWCPVWEHCDHGRAVHGVS